ncbi:MAG: glycoside hydrolase family 2 protein [Anaerolineae bacterium]
MKSLSLDGTWSLRYCDAGQGEAAGWPAAGVAGEGALGAVVPGEVHLDLARAGEVPDPLYGTNTRDLGWMEEKDWWYSTSVTVAADFPGDRVELVFAGLDTLADVWLNGELLGSTRNQLVEHALDVTNRLHPGENLLVVRLDTGLRWARQQEMEKYHWKDEYDRPGERIWLRRAQFSWTWDFAPRLLTAGIWQPVVLRSYEGVALRDVHLTASLCGETQALLRAQYEIESYDDQDRVATIELRLEGANGVRKRLLTTLVPGYNLVTDTITVAEPRLWWPNGMGEAYLYDVECVVEIDGDPLDGRTMRYGIREIDVVQEPLERPEEQSFTFRVNGRSLFAKGANWIAADSIIARSTPERYEALIQDAADANYNMLRLWGGGTYEADAWWDACDEHGILVWLDFMFAVAAIPDDDPAFAEEVRQEAGKVVRRLRNRASLAMWCGNNENQWLSRKYRPETIAYGRRTYHRILPEVCARLDPTRFYWHSSPWGGGEPNSMAFGDRHAWEITLNADDENRRVLYQDIVEEQGKLISEYGYLGPSREETLRRYLPEAEVHRDSDAWAFHRNLRDEGMTDHAIEHYFGLPAKGLPLPIYIAFGQAYQAEALRYTIGHLRRLWPTCSGSLFWMHNDTWGASTSWSVIDYDLRRKPAFYAVREAYAPVMVALVRETSGISVWLVNDHQRPITGRLEYGRGSLDSGNIEVIESTGVVATGVSANRATQLLVPNLPEEEARERYYWVRFVPRNGPPAQDVLLLSNHWGDLDLQPTAVNHSLAPLGDGRYRLSMSADRFVWGLWIDHGEDVRIEDNYIDLLPGVAYATTVTGPPEQVEGITLTSLNDWLRRVRAGATPG